MADYFLGNFPQGGYSPVHKGGAPKHSKPWSPNFEISQGMRFGLNYPAPYLALERYEAYFRDYIVISGGKPVALASDGYMVPAGFKKLIAAGGSAGPQYTQLDIDLGVLDAQGNVPSVSDYVVDAMIAASISVGYCAGIASYNAYQLSGSDPTNPATYKFHNYNRQTGVAILTDYYLEYPVEPLKRTKNTITATIAGSDQGDYDLAAHTTVLDYTIKVKINGRRDVDFTFVNGAPDSIDWNSGTTDNYLKIGDLVEIEYYFEEVFYQAPLTGIASWRGAAKPGDYVVVDVNSCFVAYAPGAIGDTSGGDESANVLAAIDSTLDIVGQVYLVDSNFPKQFLDKVKTAYDDRLHGPIMDGKTGELRTLDRMPGSATDGMPHNIFYAGGDRYTGIVRFNLNIR